MKYIMSCISDSYSYTSTIWNRDVVFYEVQKSRETVLKISYKVYVKG